MPRRPRRRSPAHEVSPRLLPRGLGGDARQPPSFCRYWRCASRNHRALSRAREKAVKRSAVSASPALSVSSIAARTALATFAYQLDQCGQNGPFAALDIGRVRSERRASGNRLSGAERGFRPAGQRVPPSCRRDRRVQSGKPSIISCKAINCGPLIFQWRLFRQESKSIASASRALRMPDRHAFGIRVQIVRDL